MKNKIMWLCLSLLIVASMLIASCSTSTTTSTPTSTIAATTTKTTTTATTSTITTPATTTAITTTATTTTSTGNWWDSQPQPQYGGTLILRQNNNFVAWDPGLGTGIGIVYGYMEQLFNDQWTTDPSIFNYKVNFRPDNFCNGDLAQSW